MPEFKGDRLSNIGDSIYDKDAVNLRTLNKKVANLTSGTTGQTIMNGNYLPLSGGTVSGNTNFNNGAIIQSGGTDLYSIFSTPTNILLTHVQPGTNILTGGTSFNPTVNLFSSPSINNLFFSGTATGNIISTLILSGNTIYSGSTNLSTYFGNLQSEINLLSGLTTGYTLLSIFTGYTASTDTVLIGLQNQLNTKSNLSGATFTGLVNGIALSGTSVSGDTYFSGSTPLSTIIRNISSQYSGVTGNFLPLSGGTVSGNTNFNNGAIIQSGGTDLYNIFSQIGGQVTGVQSGRNISTGGTSLNPIINLIPSPVINNLSFSGTSTGNALSATTLSGGTIYSGSTNLYNIFTQPSLVVNSVEPGTNITTGGTLTFPTINLVSSPSINNFLFSGTATGNGLFSTTLSGGTIYSGSTNLYSIFSTPSSIISTYVQPGSNILTGGTNNNPIINLVSSPSINNLILSGIGNANSFSGTSISGGTIFSGSTDLSSLFATQILTTNLQNQLNTKSNLSGATFTGLVNGVSFSGTSISGSTIFSGNTNLYSIFAPLGGEVISIQPGTNITTGGTITNPIINLVNNPSVNNFSFSGTATGNAFSASTLSGGTIYSGSTNLYNIFATSSSIIPTYVQPGTNITTGGTSSNPIINLVSSPSINNLTLSGTGNANSFSATTLSGGTIFSGSTDLSSLFATQSLTTNLQNQLNTKVNLSGATFTGQVNGISFSGTSISGGTIYSGSTNLYSIFATPSSIVSTYIQPGLNTYTGGTNSNPTVNISAATLTSLSASTLSGGTIYSGSTPLQTIINNLSPSLIVSSTTITNGNNGAIFFQSGSTLWEDKNNLFFDSINKNLAVGTNSFDVTNPEKIKISAGITSSVNLLYGYSNINNYTQIGIQNVSTGNSASSDFVSTSDNGSQTDGYVDLGINNSNFSSQNWGSQNDAYLYVSKTGATGGNLFIGTNTNNKAIYFYTSGGTVGNERMRITDNNVSAGAFSATTLSGGTIYSGLTDLNSLFATQSLTTNLQNQLNTKANLSGATFTGQISAPTVSATTYLNLPKDVFTTGGTYSNGTATFGNSTGGTFAVSGFYTGYTAPTDIFVTGGTYSNGTAVFGNSTGGTFSVTGFSTATSFTGGTVAGNTNFTSSLSASTYYSGSTPLQTIISNMITAVPPTVNIGNTLFVSSTGSDLTGTRGNLASPYKTIGGALSAATTGDTVFIFAGTFTETGLFKDGINYYFANGATISPTGTTSIFTVNNPTRDFNVDGFLTISSAQNGCAFDIQLNNNNVNYYLKFKSITMTNVTGFDTLAGAGNTARNAIRFVTQQGNANVYGDIKITSTLSTQNSGGFSCVTDGVNLYYNGNITMTSTSPAFYSFTTSSPNRTIVGNFTSSGSTGTIYLNNDRAYTNINGVVANIGLHGYDSGVYALNSNLVYLGGVNFNGTIQGNVWLQGASNNSQNINGAINAAQNYASYIRLSSGNNNINASVFNGGFYIDGGVNVINGNIVWASNGNVSNVGALYHGAGTTFFKANSTSFNSRNYYPNTVTGGLFRVCKDSNLYLSSINGGAADANYGITVNGGTMIVEGVIDYSTTTATASLAPIKLTSGTLVLDGGRIINRQTGTTSSSISATTNQNIKIYNNSYANFGISGATLSNVVTGGGSLFVYAGLTE